MGRTVSLFTIVVAAIVAAWWWLGAPAAMPPSPLGANEKLPCVSYAPFRAAQTPLDPATRIEPERIERDLARLSRVTECIRTYSVDRGLDRVPDIARKYGLKVMLGLWISGHADRTQYQIDIGGALARRFPDVVRAVVVGNEALLRGEISPAALSDLIRRVKARVPAPVTYADAWAVWLRHRDLAGAVDFVTTHVLPYWEDAPVAARQAADHVASIRRRVAAELVGKEVMIGEVGWPGAGRMRGGARPSPANQARVVQDVLARAKRDNFRVNIVEAFDQPWRREQEGTVGGHWGLFDQAGGARKFEWGMPVSNHPHWQLQAAGGLVFAAFIFAAASMAGRREAREPGWAACSAIALNAAVAAVLVGWAVENVLLESLGLGGWLHATGFVAVAVAAPIMGAMALAMGVPCPAFARAIGAKADRTRSPLSLTLGLLLIAATVLALQSALAIAFDGRIRDIPFAPLTAAVVPFALLALVAPRPAGARPLAERVAACVLVPSAAFIVWNESPSNWQALWFAGALCLLAFTLFRARAAPG